MNKNVNEAYDLLESVATNIHKWALERGALRKVAEVHVQESSFVTILQEQVANMTKLM